MNETQIAALKMHVQQLRANFGGWFFYYCLRHRRQIVLANLNLVFGKYLSSVEIKKLALSFYSHFTKTLCENILFRFRSLDAIRDKVIVQGEENVLNAAEAERGVLLLTGHFGNWELAPIGAMLNFTQYQHHFHVVRKTLSIKWIEKILFNRFFKVGIRVIPNHNALSKVCDVLEKNQGVIFVYDQHAGLDGKDSVVVDFFGRAAGTYRSLPMIAQHTGAKVVPAVSYRRNDGKHVVAFLPAVPWIAHDDSKEEIRLNAQQYNHVLEDCILAHPEQWLWTHKRWRVIARDRKRYSEQLFDLLVD